jgi:hypothetical protein
MPYWAIFCLYCQGYISDALLECLPPVKKAHPAYPSLFSRKPGAALACPYCNGLIGFDASEQPRVPEPGWPVFRYSRVELESKKLDDGANPAASLGDWASAFRFTKPGTHPPFGSYTYAEQAPVDENVP